MESEVSLPYAQEHATESHLKPDEHNPHSYFNIWPIL